jgi:hypothetical protein
MSLVEFIATLMALYFGFAIVSAIVENDKINEEYENEQNEIRFTSRR